MAPFLGPLGIIFSHLLSTPSTTITNPTAHVVNEARNLYNDLRTPGPLSIPYSPTVTFSFVPPPPLTNNTSSSSSTTSFTPLRSWESRPTPNTSPSTTPTTTTTSVRDTIATDYGTSKPIVIYLPGADGLGISATSQFDSLAQTFEFWRLAISPDDRSTFNELTNYVVRFVEEYLLAEESRSSTTTTINGMTDETSDKVKSQRDILLIGESFGGLLAPSVAIRLSKSKNIKDALKGMVLVNPATSFDQSSWDIAGPLLTSLRFLENNNNNNNNNNNDTPSSSSSSPRQFPSLYSLIGGTALAAAIPDRRQFQWILDGIVRPSAEATTSLASAQDTFSSLASVFNLLETNLPAETMAHRLSLWLPVGSAVVNPRLGDLDVPTLVVSGVEDNLLPTKGEADRLVNVMKNCRKVEVRGSGHFVLDGRVNLTRVVLDAGFLVGSETIVNKKKKDPIVDWVKPSKEVRDLVIERNVMPLRNLVSPVFFSTSDDGTRRMGLGGIPSEQKDGPLLFVANHQFGGLDLSLIISELIEQRDIYARGLAHPIIFNATTNSNNNNNNNTAGNNFAGGPGPNPLAETDPLYAEPLFQTFGAVMVTPRNYYRLLQTNQSALLFPGGVREVFHGKDEAYQLFWPGDDDDDKTDFVRIAAKFNATIVPLSAVGAADSVNIILDAKEIVELPFGLGERAKKSSANVMAARFDTDDEEELFTPPLAFPKLLPARHYFMFGKAMRTTDVDHGDRAACRMFYDEVKREMNRGFDDLLRAREDDPFKDTARRILYEQVTRKRAPTFGLDRFRH